MRNPKISVIVPMYNAATHIEASINSIREQSIEDIEILCIDDGSSDDTAKIVKDIANADERIIYLSQRNSGPAVARNFGIDKAKGEYIAFMDSDDFYPELDTLSTMYAAAIDNGALICGGEMSDYDDLTHKIVTDYPSSLYGYHFFSDGWVDYKDYQFDFGYYRFIYSAKFIKDNGIKFPERRRYEDPLFFVNAMHIAGRFYALNKVTYRYRINQIRPGHWDAKSTIDALQGLIDVLDFSVKYHYVDLHVLCLERLSLLLQPAITYCFDDKENGREIVDLLEIIDNKISPIMIQQSTLTFAEEMSGAGSKAIQKARDERKTIRYKLRQYKLYYILKDLKYRGLR